jgi:hypothetical protein
MKIEYYFHLRNVIPKVQPDSGKPLELAIANSIISKYAITKLPTIDISSAVIYMMAKVLKAKELVEGLKDAAKYYEIRRAIKAKTPSHGAVDKLNVIAWKLITAVVDKHGPSIKTGKASDLINSVNIGFDDQFKNFVGILNFFELVRYQIMGYAVTMAPSPTTPWHILSRLLLKTKHTPKRDHQEVLSVARAIIRAHSCQLINLTAPSKRGPGMEGVLVGTRGTKINPGQGVAFEIKFKPLIKFRDATESLNEENDFYGTDFCALFTLLPFIDKSEDFRTIEEALPSLKSFLLSHPSIWQYNSRFMYSQPTLAELRDFFKTLHEKLNYVLMTVKGPIHVDHDARITLLIYDGHVELWAGQPLYDSLIKEESIQNYLDACD